MLFSACTHGCLCLYNMPLRLIYCHSEVMIFRKIAKRSLLTTKRSQDPHVFTTQTLNSEYFML